MAKPSVNVAATLSSLDGALNKLIDVSYAELDDLKRLQDIRARITSGRILHRVIGLIRLPWINWRIKRSISRVTTLVTLLNLIDSNLTP